MASFTFKLRDLKMEEIRALGDVYELIRQLHGAISKMNEDSEEFRILMDLSAKITMEPLSRAADINKRLKQIFESCSVEVMFVPT